MPPRSVGLSDVSLRCLDKLAPPFLASWSNLAPVLETLDKSGLRSIEVWGGMSVDHCLSRLQESPWERIAGAAKYITNTPVRLELRGRCLVGSRPFPSALVEAFVCKAAASGVGEFLVYEPLNDPAGLDLLVRAVKASGAGLILGIVSSGDPNQGEVLARLAADMGPYEPDAFCLKIAGSAAPSTVRHLVEALVTAMDLPLEVAVEGPLGGMAALVSAEAAGAGASVIHGSAAPAWLDGSAAGFPALLSLLADARYATDMYAEPLALAGSAFADAIRDGIASLDIAEVTADVARVDWRKLEGIPGEVVRQVAHRLRAMGAGDRLPEVVSEMDRVRDEVGRPALVAPVAQILATVAVLNVVYGRRWQMIPDEMKAYLRGDYGSPPEQQAPDLPRDAVVSDSAVVSSSEAASFADFVAGVGSSAVLPGDDLLYALAPEAMVRFVQERAAASELDEMFRQTVADESGTIPEEPWRDLGPDRLRELISMLESSSVDELTLENRGTRVTLRKASSPGSVPAGAATSAAPASPGAEVGADAHPDQDETRFIVGASMVGTFYRSPAPGVAPYVEVGSHVSKGEALCVLEAMKLMNELISEVSGEVLAVLAEDGTAVEYGQPLFLIRLETE